MGRKIFFGPAFDQSRGSSMSDWTGGVNTVKSSSSPMGGSGVGNGRIDTGKNHANTRKASVSVSHPQGKLGKGDNQENFGPHTIAASGGRTSSGRKSKPAEGW